MSLGSASNANGDFPQRTWHSFIQPFIPQKLGYQVCDFGVVQVGEREVRVATNAYLGQMHDGDVRRLSSLLGPPAPCKMPEMDDGARGAASFPEFSMFHYFALTVTLLMTFGTFATIEAAQDQSDDVIARLTREIEVDPNNARIYVQRGDAFTDKGEGEGKQAIADYGRAIERDPTFFDAYYNRGVAYARKRDRDSAIADLTRSLVQPYDRDAAMSVGRDACRLMCRFLGRLDAKPRHARPRRTSEKPTQILTRILGKTDHHRRHGTTLNCSQIRPLPSARHQSIPVQAAELLATSASLWRSSAMKV
jgi:hypothetical protein